jgi:hypothetical protein
MVVITDVFRTDFVGKIRAIPIGVDNQAKRARVLMLSLMVLFKFVVSRTHDREWIPMIANLRHRVGTE